MSAKWQESTNTTRKRVKMKVKVQVESEGVTGAESMRIDLDDLI